MIFWGALCPSSSKPSWLLGLLVDGCTSLEMDIVEDSASKATLQVSLVRCIFCYGIIIIGKDVFFLMPSSCSFKVHDCD